MTDEVDEVRHQLLTTPDRSGLILILASGSPRRRQLLEMLGIPHRVEASAVQEIPLPREAPRHYARRLAREKARAVAGAYVLGADTIVVLNDRILEKPSDHADALRMLLELQGCRHEVITAVCLLAHGNTYEAIDTTVVFFRPADEETLLRYVETGEPMDKAGAYGIQGFGAALIERIEGDFFSVMGLPVRLVLDLLAEAGWPYRFGK